MKGFPLVHNGSVIWFANEKRAKQFLAKVGKRV